MRIRKNDNDNDWMFGNSDNTFMVNNGAGVAQKVKTRLQEWLNDCFFNQQAGIDYKVRMGQRGQRAQLDDDIKRVISETEEVVLLSEYSSELYDRELRVNFAFYHIFGEEVYSDFIVLQGVQYA